MEVILDRQTIFVNNTQCCVNSIQKIIKEKGLNPDNYYLLSNGKLVSDKIKPLNTCKIYVVPRLVGGKGGFGSMLRAIGAQIEKTTNREACRDLSGRRLRDINEEQRLKNWISQQADREKEAKERKQKKLERLCEQPKHEFKDEQYDAERSSLPEKVEDAVLKGLEASASCSSKRKLDDKKDVKKKKPKLWVDDELDDLSSSEEIESDEDEKSNLDNKEQYTVKKNVEETNGDSNEGQSYKEKSSEETSNKEVGECDEEEKSNLDRKEQYTVKENVEKINRDSNKGQSYKENSSEEISNEQVGKTVKIG